MGDTILTRRFGSGLLKHTDALLRVIAPTNSVVTITKDGETKKADGHLNANDNTLSNYYFIIPASKFDDINPWTITATLGVIPISDTVIIDSNLEYTVSLTSFEYVVYNTGTVADGLEPTITTTNGTATLNSSYISFTHNASSNAQPRVVFYPIDLTPFTTMEAAVHGASGYNVVFALYVATTADASVWSSSRATSDVAAGANATIQLDVSSFSGIYYVGIASTTNNATWNYARSGQYCSKIRLYA